MLASFIARDVRSTQSFPALMASISKINDQLKGIITPDLLLKVYKLVIPWHKSCTLDWEAVGHNVWGLDPEQREHAIYHLLFHELWAPISRMPLEDLMQVNMLELLPDPDALDYLEQSLGLIYVFDQTRGYFTGTDLRYVNSFFDKLALKLVGDLLAMKDSGFNPPQSPEAWLSRGYTFDDWIARWTWLVAPLVHSETYMTQHRSSIKSIIHQSRLEVEAITRVKDPYATRESSDEKDLSLFTCMIQDSYPSKHRLGKEVEMHDYAFWLIRLFTAHFALTDNFGRYPYRNDAIGRDFAKGEMEWMKGTGVFERLDEDVREQIRKDVDAGQWSPLKGNPRFKTQATRWDEKL